MYREREKRMGDEIAERGRKGVMSGVGSLLSKKLGL
jgi:hypothetical protein